MILSFELRLVSGSIDSELRAGGQQRLEGCGSGRLAPGARGSGALLERRVGGQEAVRERGSSASVARGRLSGAPGARS
eukprot:3935828-Rhodomonas_salina.3